MQVVCEATQCPDTRVSNLSAQPFAAACVSGVVTSSVCRCVWLPCRTW